MKRIFIVVAAAIYSSLGTKYTHTHTQNMASSSIIITCRKIFITLHYLLPDTGTYRHNHLLDCHQRKIERKNKTEYQQNKKHSNIANDYDDDWHSFKFGHHNHHQKMSYQMYDSFEYNNNQLINVKS